ncbi:MAG TPA: Flp pilus assembly protein CpaB, partial [Tepidisphaeraceae bacterium]
VKTVSVVVAKAAIPPGTALTSEDVGLAAIAAQTAPTDSFTNPADLVGRVTSAPTLQGQPFLRPLLAPVGTAPGLQALVPPGLRAVTIDVNESTGVAGLLAPGFHVDVISTGVNPDPTKAVSRVIVQNVPVVAVGQRLGGPKAEGDKEVAVARTVTLLVTPHAAEALDIALASGRLRLALRSIGDTLEEEDGGVNWATLLGISAPPLAVQDAVFTSSPPPATRPDQDVVFTSQPPPTTRPNQEQGAPGMPAARIVTIILGSEEHQLTFQEPMPVRPTDFTDVSQQHAIPN